MPINLTSSAIPASPETPPLPVRPSKPQQALGGSTVGGESDQFNLAAIPNLSSVPATSGQPGGWKGRNCRLGSGAAQAEVEAVMVKIDTSSPATTAISTQNMSVEAKAIAAKGGGCGGRRATAQGIFSGSKPASKEEQARWKQRVTNLSASGIVESDGLSPSNVSIDDWCIAVAGPNWKESTNGGFMGTVNKTDV